MWESLFQKVTVHGPPEKSHRRETLWDVDAVDAVDAVVVENMSMKS